MANEESGKGQPTAGTLTDDQITTERSMRRRSFLTAVGVLVAGGAAALATNGVARAADPDQAPTDPDRKKKSSDPDQASDPDKKKSSDPDQASDPDKAPKRPDPDARPAPPAGDPNGR